MKRSTAYLAFALVAAVVFAAVEMWYRTALNARLQRYRSERAAIERVEQGYRRPVLDESADQNAASVYGRILPKLARTPIEALRPALEAGAERYDVASGALFTGACAEALGEDAANVMRSAALDWRLGFGTASENRFDRPREALALSLCLTVAGHRSARQGALADASRHYLDGLAVACDLGHGSETMLVVALRAAQENLKAIGKLAASANDLLFLRRLGSDLSQFEGRLPDGHIAFRRTVLWTQNEVGLQELETAHQYDTFGFIGLKQILAARALEKEQTLFDDAAKLGQATTRPEATRLASTLRSDVEASTNDVVKLVNLSRASNLLIAAMDLGNTFRDVSSTIELRQHNLQTGMR